MRVTAEAFDYPDALPEVLGGLNTPIPFWPPLEDARIPQVADIADKIRQITV